ncbi:uncharacterized protein LOC119097344 [Pollicipes pollicipes]|uniref:uncharacterized protein LOC119097344 n=1 Tax=Pollicipes pollicipes TaxID=41117 RepID=UPI001884BA5F|nr:uncharacterized protein LOC119097344 [Pollicipes pollicipes]
MPELLPDWPMEVIAVWLSVAEGILLVPLLLCVDPLLRLAVRGACTKPHADDCTGDGGDPFRSCGKESHQSAEAKFPITNGSLFSLQDGASLHAVRSRCMKMGVGMLGEPTGKPRFLPTLYDPSRLAGGGDARSEPLYSDPLTKTASLDSIIKCLPPGDEPIYATLSTGRRSPERCNSATTIANDDFEFRGSKRFCSPRRPPCEPPTASTRGDQMSIRSTASGVTIRRVLRYKKTSPRRRAREPPLRSAIVHRQGHSLLALNELRADHVLHRGEIVSVEALNQAMALTPYSYLDNGEVYRHHSRSVPDFQKVFISGYL